MGYGALIGGIISAVGGIASSALNKSGGAQANTNAVAAGHQINVARQRYLDPFTNANYWNLNLPQALQQSFNIGEQYAPQLNQFNQQQLTNLISGVFPGGYGNLTSMLGMQAQNVRSELLGEVPADVQNQIQRAAAGQTIASGIGAGGGPGAAGAPFSLTGKTITARDLGLTSLSLMQQGQAGLGSLLGMTRNYLMPQPVNPMSILPWQNIVQGEQWSKEAQFEANAAAFQASALGSTTGLLGQVPTQSQGSQITSGIGGLLQGLGQTSPQTGQTGFGMLGNLFGGMNLSGFSGGGGATVGSLGGGGTSDFGSLFGGTQDLGTLGGGGFF